MAGEGPCFRCNCSWHTSKVVEAWERRENASKTDSFKEFADKFLSEDCR